MRKTRFLSLFLSLVFMLSVLSGAVVSAQDTTDTNTADNNIAADNTAANTAGAVTASPFGDVTNPADYEALKLLYDLDVIKGTGTNEKGVMEFTPNRDVSREEMALFIARIRSATPQYFVPDETQKTIFADVDDPTFFTAVNYCVEMDIVNGYPDGSFKPKDTVTLQEAAKMMVTALGYTALSYPVGYLSKANEPDVNLLNGFQSVSGTKTLTRIEVARLLYNYFLSNYNYVDVTYNSIDKKYESTLITKPVCEKFGIEKTTAYITGVQDYAIDLVVKDSRITSGEVTLTGQALTAKEATIGSKNDLYVSYYTTVSSTATGATVVTPRLENVKMSKTRLGYASDFDATTLLGLKVTMYRSIRNNNVTVPTSYVTGTKTTVNSLNETTATAATIEGNNYDVIKNLVINGRAYDLNPPADITNRDIYTAGTSTTYTNRTSSLLEMARMIANKGYYKLQFVDNGRDNQGNEESYYIFTPFSVGYYNGVDNDGKILLSGEANGKTDADLIKNLSAGGTAVTLTKGEAYLYTIEGNHLNVYKQLHKVASGVSPAYIYGNIASFPNITVTFGRETQYLARNALSTATTTIRAGGTYSIFSFAANTTPFFVHETTAPVTAVSKDYAVITDASATTGVIDGKVAYLFTGVTMYSNTKTSMMISTVNGSQISPSNVGDIRVGEVVAYRKTGNTYEVYTESDTVGFVNSGQKMKSKVASGTSMLTKGTAADFEYLPSSGVMTINSSGDVGVITGNTKIILVDAAGTDARVITKSEFDARMAAVAAGSVDAKKILMVTKTTAASEALIAVVRAHSTFVTAAAAHNLGIVTVPFTGAVSGTYETIATVYSYKLGTTVDVAGSAADLAFGNIVNISANTITIGTSTVYTTAPIVPVSPATPTSLDDTLKNATTDISKILGVSIPANQLNTFTKEVLVTYGSPTSLNVKTLNANKVNLITVNLYTALAANAAQTSGTSAPNWRIGTNATASMTQTDLASISDIENSKIFTFTGDPTKDIYKYYVHVNDVNNTGAADFITIIRYVINTSPTF